VCEKRRFIYSAENRLKIPGTLVRREGDPSGADREVNEAYDGLGATYDLFCNEYNRDSIDNRGMELNATVHYGFSFDNAYWDDRMVFGDGDEKIELAEERLWNPFTRSVDVIGHELTHGVTEFTAKLVYVGQPGALNESISDVFGSLVKQYMLHQTVDKADWLIGAELFVPSAVSGVAIRSMAAPGTAYDDPVLGKDPQPAHMDNFVRTVSDNFGVHINSGIPNHAFYLTAQQIGGFAWERAGLIWYATLTHPALPRSALFQDFADITLLSARRIFGAGSLEYRAIREGWAGVGIEV
jgi:Zn-dependent metalloprotease